MKAVIKGLAASVGLVSAGDVERVAAQAREAAQRARELEGRLAKLRDDVQGWKDRYESSVAAVAEWKQTAAAANTKADRAAADAARAEARAEEWKTRSEALGAQVNALRERLDKANHATATAREHLMATEVKLDLIEAAIHILDQRTRETAVTRS
jgi:chromosome segregation ATPase